MMYYKHLVLLGMVMSSVGCVDLNPQEQIMLKSNDSTYLIYADRSHIYLGPSMDPLPRSALATIDQESAGCYDLIDFPLIQGDFMPETCGNFKIHYKRENAKVTATAYCKNLPQCSVTDLATPVAKLEIVDGWLMQFTLGPKGSSATVFSRQPVTLSD